MVVHCLGCLVSCFGAQPLEFDEGRMPPSGTPDVAEIPTAPLYEPPHGKMIGFTPHHQKRLNAADENTPPQQQQNWFFSPTLKAAPNFLSPFSPQQQPTPDFGSPGFEYMKMTA